MPYETSLSAEITKILFEVPEISSLIGSIMLAEFISLLPIKTLFSLSIVKINGSFSTLSDVHTLESCIDGEQYSKLTITNNGSTTQYYQVQIQINNGNWDTKFPSSPIPGGQNLEFKWPIQQGETIRWQYVASTDTDFSNDSLVPSLAKTNQCTPVFSLQTQTACADASTLNNNQVNNTKVTLTGK